MTHPAPDGDLRATRRTLADSIHKLVGRRTLHIDRDVLGDHYNPRDPQVVWGDSLYHQLVDAVTAAQGTQHGGHARSLPTVHLSAVQLLTKIDKTVRTWQPDPGIFDGDLATEPTPETVRRLHLIADTTWRPQDCQLLAGWAKKINGWIDKIGEILDPTPMVTLSNPCPACGTAIVYRKDDAGETVRQPALQIGKTGCECQHCHHTWSPDQYVFLARVLGGLPDNVLE